MRILLVDDEPLAIERMRVALAGVADAEVVGCAGDGEEAGRRIAALDPDLVLLDIQMPGLTGMDLARRLADAPSRPELVFVTAFNDFAIEAFDVEAVDYLLKPVSFDRLRMAIDRVRRRRALLESGVVQEGAGGRPVAVDDDGGYDDGIWVPGRQGAVRVPIETIDRIEAARDYVLLNTPVRSYILRARMSEIERRIDPRHMVRIHRSHMVRIDSVVGVERPGKGALRLLLNDGANLQVGPNYQPQVVRALRL
ncbi:MAG: response regulator transcription factor [Proteobacteria bacterium]|nr:response regulator transcription factor [Pseudomonadota bacterium]